MRISRIDLLNHTFTRTVRGYAPVEVDAVIKEAATAIGSLNEEKNALEARLRELEAQLEGHRDRESTLRDTLVTTQRVTSDLKAAAKQEAQVIIEAAHAKAERLLNQCTQRLARLRDEIATAHRVRAQVYMQVRAALEQHLTLLDMTFAEQEATDAMDLTNLTDATDAAPSAAPTSRRAPKSTGNPKQ